MIRMHSVNRNMRGSAPRLVSAGAIAVGLILIICLLVVGNGGTATPGIAPPNQGGPQAAQVSNASEPLGNLGVAGQRSISVEEYLQRIGSWAVPQTYNSTQRSGPTIRESLSRIGSWAVGYEYGGPTITIEEYLRRVGSWAVHPASTGDQQP